MIKERTVRQRQLSCDCCGNIFRGDWDDGYSATSEVNLIDMALNFSGWDVRRIKGVDKHFCCRACCNAYCYIHGEKGGET